MRGTVFAVLLAAFSVGLGAGCDGPARGVVNVALSSNDESAFTIHFAWQIRSPDGTRMASGLFDASDSNATASVSLQVPVGMNDTAMLIGSTNVGVVCAGISAPFDVTAARAASVDLSVVCFSVGAGGTVSSASAGASACPAVLGSGATPNATAPGHFDATVQVSQPATSGPVSYLWSAVSGAFADPDAAQTGYDCGASGQILLSALVADEQLPRPCANVITLPSVTCP
jgi:hypothetical protein